MMDTIWLILTAISWGYMACVLISILAAPLRAYLVKKTEIQERLRKDAESRVHAIKIEQHDGIEYWFDQDSDQFIAQGRTFADIAKVLRQRWSTHIFLASKDIVLAGPTFEPISADEFRKG